MIKLTQNQLVLTTKLFAFFIVGLVISGCTSENGSNGGGGQDADPVVVDFPIAYIKRALPVDENGAPVVENPREPIAFNPSAILYVRDRATPSAGEVDITSQAFPEGSLYDVKDVEASYDGEKIIFAMRAPEIPDVDDDEQPTWNIWEYDNRTKALRRIIESDIRASAGQDVAPHYLPDGRIVFSSTRQRIAKAILLDEGKPQFGALDEDRSVEALSLHVMQDDGSEINQITFNQSHDMHPSVLDNGKIVFSRWDNYGRNRINLYQVNPDGTGLEILYGMVSHDTGSDGSEIDFMKPRQIEDGRLLVQLAPTTRPRAPDDQNQDIPDRSFTRLGGEFALIDWQNFIDINQTINLPTGAANANGLGQDSATPFIIRTDDNPSQQGRFADIYPFYDGTRRLLVSFSQCRIDAVDEQDNPTFLPCSDENLAQDDIQEASPRYGIWLYNPEDTTLRPIVLGEENVMTHEVVSMTPRELPTILTDVDNLPGIDLDLIAEKVGVINIRSVYDIDGADTSILGIAATADPIQARETDRTARFIRVVKAVSIPDDDLVDLDGTAFGVSARNLMREILGYAVVEPDGSAKFKVPADVAFSIEVLNSGGRRISDLHQNWLSIQAGEEKKCQGCHTRNSELPHGRLDAQAPSANIGALSNGYQFPNSDAALFADQGETMAEVISRINGTPELSVDINFTDVWTDTSVAGVNTFDDIDYEYTSLTTPFPTSLACTSDWNSLCRIVINYPEHIQPIWEADRAEVDDQPLDQNRRCTICHSRVDLVDQPQIPEGQLELTNEPSVDDPDELVPNRSPDHLVSYSELFINGPELILDENGGLVKAPLVEDGNIVYRVVDGELQLDDNGDPIPEPDKSSATAPLNLDGAQANQRFLRLFRAGGSHYNEANNQAWLSQAEMKLIAEWLDIGAQYYNNPFDVPQN